MVTFRLVTLTISFCLVSCKTIKEWPVFVLYFVVLGVATVRLAAKYKEITRDQAVTLALGAGMEFAVRRYVFAIFH